MPVREFHLFVVEICKRTNMEATIDIQRNESDLRDRHHHRRLQDAPKHLVQLKLCGDRARNLQEKIALADLDVRQR